MKYLLVASLVVGLLFQFFGMVHAGDMSKKIGEKVGSTTHDTKDYYNNNKDKWKDTAVKTGNKVKDITVETGNKSKYYYDNHKDKWKDNAVKTSNKIKKEGQDFSEGVSSGYNNPRSGYNNPHSYDPFEDKVLQK